MRTFASLGALLALATLSAFSLTPRRAALATGGSTLNRPEDPVVLTGADVPALQGIAPNDLVAFKYDAGVWTQVPVQVDERALRDIGTIYNLAPNGVMSLVYSDGGTFMTGAQGTVIIAGSAATNIPGFTYSTYYLDDAAPSTTQCTGDTHSYASSGVWLTSTVPCTDPGLSCTTYLTTSSTLYYEPPSQTVANAQALDARALASLTFTSLLWLPGGDSDADGIPDVTDNCPAVANAGQQNNDRNFIDLPPSKSFDDTTLANSDTAGDACDADDDNDGLSDTAETAGPPCPSATGPTNPLVADTDGDRVLDGAECALGSNPNDPASKPAIPSSTNDPDGDRLSTQFELAIGTDPLKADTDGDGLNDGLEVKFYGTNPLKTNTDGDTCPDAAEVASINGDAVVNVLDLQNDAIQLAPAPYILDFDVNKDGIINVLDLQFIARQLGTC